MNNNNSIAHKIASESGKFQWVSDYLKPMHDSGIAECLGHDSNHNAQSYICPANKPDTKAIIVGGTPHTLQELANCLGVDLHNYKSSKGNSPPTNKVEKPPKEYSIIPNTVPGNFDGKPGKYHQKALHTYYDESGNIAFFKVRYESNSDKTFRVWSKNSNKKYIMRRGRGPLLYNLTEIQKSPQGATIYIVGGEKCADAINGENGIIATTPDSGEGKWDDAFTQYFEGKDVVVIVDNDTTGIEAGEKYAKELVSHTLSVKVVNLYDPTIEADKKKDIYDWLHTDGGTIEKLQDIVSQAPKWVPTQPEKPPLPTIEDLKSHKIYKQLEEIYHSGANREYADKQATVLRYENSDISIESTAMILNHFYHIGGNLDITRFQTASELLNEDLPDLEYIVDDLLLEGGINVLLGKPKAGKSWVALSIAYACSLGSSLFGEFQCKKMGCIYFSLEDSKQSFQARMKKTIQNNGGAIPDFHIVTGNTEYEYGDKTITGLPPLDKGGYEIIDDYLTKRPTAKLVILDMWAKIKPSKGRNVDEYDFIYEHFGKLQAIAHKHSATILIVHHMRKVKGGDSLIDSALGSTAIAGAATTLWGVDKATDGGGEAYTALRITGKGIAEKALKLQFDNEHCSFTYDGEIDESDSLSGLPRDIYELLDEPDMAMTFSEICDALGSTDNNSKAKIKTTLQRLCKGNHITQTKKGNKSEYKKRD